MKKLHFNLLLIALLAGSLAFLPGCGSTPASKAAQGERIVIHSVNDAMTEWAAYVNAGKATAQQIKDVQTAYDAYFAAQQVAKAAIEKLAVAESGGQATSPADVATANAAVTNAENTLIGLIGSIIH